MRDIEGKGFSFAIGIMLFCLLSAFEARALEGTLLVVDGEWFGTGDLVKIDCATGQRTSLVSGEVFNLGANENNIQKIGLGEAVQRLVPGTDLEFVVRDEDPRSYRVDFAKIAERLAFTADWSIDDGIAELAPALAQGVFGDPAEPRYHN